MALHLNAQRTQVSLLANTGTGWNRLTRVGTNTAFPTQRTFVLTLRVRDATSVVATVRATAAASEVEVVLDEASIIDALYGLSADFPLYFVGLLVDNDGDFTVTAERLADSSDGRNSLVLNGSQVFV